MKDAKKRNKNVGPRSQKRIPVRVSVDEYDQIKRTAEKVRLPVSTLLRELALGHNPPSRIEQRTFLEVVHLRGDLGRLGGLLKMWLVDAPGEAVSEADVRSALHKILSRQDDISDLLDQLRNIIPAKP
ncbi:plasmid mobilization protein [Zymomonas mobilis]|nr:conjugal transfer protein TraJ [Zymomonas mobilis]